MLLHPSPRTSMCMGKISRRNAEESSINAAARKRQKREKKKRSYGRANNTSASVSGLQLPVSLILACSRAGSPIRTIVSLRVTYRGVSYKSETHCEQFKPNRWALHLGHYIRVEQVKHSCYPNILDIRPW